MVYVYDKITNGQLMHLLKFNFLITGFYINIVYHPYKYAKTLITY